MLLTETRDVNWGMGKNMNEVEQSVEKKCPPELTRLVSFQIRLAQLAVSRVFNKFMRDTGLTHVQYSALRIIAANDGINQRDLALASGTPQTVMVSSLGKLEKLDLITRSRSDKDRRQYHISLSRGGTALLKKYGTVSRRAHDSLLKGLKEQEIAVLMKCLKHIAAKT